MKLPQRLGALILSALTLSLFTAIVALVPQARAEEGADNSAALNFAISSLTPEVFADEGPLEIRTTVQSPPESLVGGRVEVFLEPTPFVSSDDADHYLTGGAFPGWSLTAQELTSSNLEPGDESGSTVIKTVVEQKDLPPLNAASSGARGITVALYTDTADFEARSILVYQPPIEAGYPQTNISTVIDVTPLQGNPNSASTLTSLLDQVGSHAGVSIAMAPEKISPPACANSQLVMRPSENADISLMASLNDSSLLELTESARTLRVDCPEVIDNVVFASPEGFTVDSLRHLDGNIVVAPAGWSDSVSQHSLVTPTAKVTVSPQTGETLPLPGMAGITVIDTWTDANDLLNQELGTPAQELLTRQMLRMDAIGVGLETPEDTRWLSTQMVFPSRASSMEQRVLAQRVEALLDATWVNPVRFDELVASPASTVARDTVPAADPQRLEAVKETLVPLTDLYRRASGIAAASSLGPRLLDPYLADLLRPTAVGLPLAQRARAVTTAGSDLADLLNAVEVVPLGTVNLLNKTANFPVAVVNHSDVELSLVVSLEPSDPRLQSRKPQHISLAAHAQEEVTIPVTAVGSGNVAVRVVVQNASGTEIAASNEGSVRVRANWEDTGTLVFAVLLCVLFTFGIVRTIRRRRRNQNPASVKEPAAGGEE